MRKPIRKKHHIRMIICKQEIQKCLLHLIVSCCPSVAIDSNDSKVTIIYIRLGRSRISPSSTSHIPTATSHSGLVAQLVEHQ